MPCPPILVQPFRRRHRSLDGQTAHILPAFLQQADQIIDGQHDVRDQLILRHAYVANSNTQAEHFLQLKFYCRLDFGDFGGEIFVVGNWGRELAGCKDVSMRLNVLWGSHQYPWRDLDPGDEVFV